MGLNLFGAVDGVGATTMTPQPVVVAGLPPIRAVVASALAGYPQSCAVATNAQLYCWGSNYEGRDYLAGSFTIADVALGCGFEGAEERGVRFDRVSRVAAWRERLRARESLHGHDRFASSGMTKPGGPQPPAIGAKLIGGANAGLLGASV